MGWTRIDWLRWRRSSWRVIGATLIGAGVLPACGRGTDHPPRSHAIVIRAFQYTPDTLSAVVGDTVVWENRDVVRHSATHRAKRLDTGTIRAGATGEWVAAQKGTFAYGCVFHPTMQGWLVVR